MKTGFRCGVIAILMCLTSSLYAGGGLGCGGELKVVLKEGGEKKGNMPLINDLQALMESCSVDSSSHAASEEKWKALLASPPFLHYALGKGLQFDLKLKGGISVAIKEVILPLPKGSFPDHIYVKNQHGYRAYTKFDPIVLRKIVGAPEVGLASEAPYNSLPSEDSARVEPVSKLSESQKKLVRGSPAVP